MEDFIRFFPKFFKMDFKKFAMFGGGINRNNIFHRRTSAIVTVILVINQLCILCSEAYFLDGDPYRQKQILGPKASYVVEWSINWKENSITFQVSAETKGWVGFGLSRDGRMSGADIIIGGVAPSGKPYFDDAHVLANRSIQIDKQQDWKLIGAWEKGKRTYLSVRRPLQTCDEDDYQITKDLVFVIWAYGLDDEVSYHDKRRGSAPAYLLDPQITDELALDHYRQIGPHSNLYLAQRWALTNKIKLAPKPTTVWCSVQRGPQLAIRHDITGMGAFLPTRLSRRHVQQIRVFKCASPQQTDAESFFEPYVKIQGEECYMNEKRTFPLGFCRELIYVHGRGGLPFYFPEEIGIPIGESPTEYFLLETTFDNPRTVPNLEIEAGVEIVFSHRQKQNSASLIQVGYGNFGTFMLPPKSVMNIYGSCGPSCTSAMFPKSGVNVFAAMLQTRQLGRQIRLQHFRGDQELKWISKDDNYDSEYQQMRLLHHDITLLPGDQLTTQCSFNSWSRNRTSFSGFSTQDEICTAYMYISTRIPYFSCTSEYPQEKLLSRYGINNVTWDLTWQDRYVTEPRELEGVWLGDIVDHNAHARTVTHDQLQNELQYQQHLESCPNIRDIMSASETKVFRTYTNDWTLDRIDPIEARTRYLTSTVSYPPDVKEYRDAPVRCKSSGSHGGPPLLPYYPNGDYSIPSGPPQPPRQTYSTLPEGPIGPTGPSGSTGSGLIPQNPDVDHSVPADRPPQKPRPAVEHPFSELPKFPSGPPPTRRPSSPSPPTVPNVVQKFEHHIFSNPFQDGYFESVEVHPQPQPLKPPYKEIIFGPYREPTESPVKGPRRPRPSPVSPNIIPRPPPQAPKQKPAAQPLRRPNMYTRDEIMKNKPKPTPPPPSKNSIRPPAKKPTLQYFDEQLQHNGKRPAVQYLDEQLHEHGNKPGIQNFEDHLHGLRNFDDHSYKPTPRPHLEHQPHNPLPKNPVLEYFEELPNRMPPSHSNEQDSFRRPAEKPAVNYFDEHPYNELRPKPSSENRPPIPTPAVEYNFGAPQDDRRPPHQSSKEQLYNPQRPNPSFDEQSHRPRPPTRNPGVEYDFRVPQNDRRPPPQSSKEQLYNQQSPPRKNPAVEYHFGDPPNIRRPPPQSSKEQLYNPQSPKLSFEDQSYRPPTNTPAVDDLGILVPHNDRRPPPQSSKEQLYNPQHPNPSIEDQSHIPPGLKYNFGNPHKNRPSQSSKEQLLYNEQGPLIKKPVLGYNFGNPQNDRRPPPQSSKEQSYRGPTDQERPPAPFNVGNPFVQPNLLSSLLPSKDVPNRKPIQNPIFEQPQEPRPKVKQPRLRTSSKEQASPPGLHYFEELPIVKQPPLPPVERTTENPPALHFHFEERPYHNHEPNPKDPSHPNPIEHIYFDEIPPKKSPPPRSSEEQSYKHPGVKPSVVFLKGPFNQPTRNKPNINYSHETGLLPVQQPESPKPKPEPRPGPNFDEIVKNAQLQYSRESTRPNPQDSIDPSINSIDEPRRLKRPLLYYSEEVHSQHPEQLPPPRTRNSQEQHTRKLKRPSLFSLEHSSPPRTRTRTNKKTTSSEEVRLRRPRPKDQPFQYQPLEESPNSREPIQEHATAALPPPKPTPSPPQKPSSSPFDLKSILSNPIFNKGSDITIPLVQTKNAAIFGAAVDKTPVPSDSQSFLNFFEQLANVFNQNSRSNENQSMEFARKLATLKDGLSVQNLQQQLSKRTGVVEEKKPAKNNIKILMVQQTKHAK